MMLVTYGLLVFGMAFFVGISALIIHRAHQENHNVADTNLLVNPQTEN